MSFINEVIFLLKTHVRDYAMYIALAVIFIYFNIATGGGFLTPRNITNLVNQTGYIAVIAVGMTLVLIIREIDLSVGYVAGFLGAVAATYMMRTNMSVWLIIIIILLFGAVIGLTEGIIIGKVRVPSFVTTLAFQFGFRGLLILITEATGTILVTNETFNALSNGFVPDFQKSGGLHMLTLVAGAVAIILVIISQVNARNKLKRYNFETVSTPVFILKILFFSVMIGLLSFALANYRGLSWTIVIVSIVVLIYNFFMNRTRLGRYIYGVGSNPEAAALSGINVKKTLYFVFASMGMLSALGGILFTSRLQSATTTAGSGFELDAIASCYIGGVSTKGGIGKVANTIVGALVIMSLTNGMNLMGVGISYQYVIKGIIFIMAVAFDVLSRGKA
ncbi:MAG TPA: sugar ABC transporter permease [Clostridiaceae bacterium]|nr:sugar ABC transporter permease [Clostridiaceae bacterium]